MTFTPRETDIISRLLYGYNNAEIARELQISESCVKQHLLRATLRAGITHGHPRTKLAMMYRAMKGENGPTEQPRLTPLETKIFRLVARGERNADIARELGTTRGVIRTYLNRMYDKFGVWNRTELASKFPEPVYVA
jgi:DNA-binding NarL/FixJ family response regulator